MIRRNISDHFIDLGLEVKKDGRHDNNNTSRITSISGCNKGINTRLDILGGNKAYISTFDYSAKCDSDSDVNMPLTEQ